MKRLLIAILLFFLPSYALAATYAAADYGDHTCAGVNIQAAIDDSADGDTVTVPAGECTISTPITVTNKRITIEGAGIDATILTSNIDQDPPVTRPGIFKVTVKPAVITGFTFTGTAPVWGAHIVFEGLNACAGASCTSDELFRVHGNKFLTGTYAIITAWTTDGFGLIDNNTFTFTEDATAMQFYGGSRDGWGNASTLGTNKAVYVENNTFTNNSAGKTRGLFDADGGARVVSRYNTITNGGLAGWHGYCGAAAGTMQAEVYNNLGSYPSGTLAFGMFLRGGTGAVYSNRLTATMNYEIALGEYRLDGLGSCAGIAKTCCTEYPCTDQIGRGTDQDLVPMYFWDNVFNGTAAKLEPYNVNEGTCDPVPDVDDYIKINRDYYDASSLSDAKVKGLAAGYAKYTCPHPLATDMTGVCAENEYGTDGYNLEGGADTFTFTLTTVGTGTVSGGATGEYSAASKITLVATSGSGYWFAGWSGACTGTSLTSNEITMSEARACTATFRANTVTIGAGGTVSIGTGGTITLSP